MPNEPAEELVVVELNEQSKLVPEEPEKEPLSGDAESDPPSYPNTENAEPKPKPGLIPERNANFLSKVTIHWMNPMFWTGWKRPLTQDDMWELGDIHNATKLGDQFESYWKDELAASDERKKALAASGMLPIVSTDAADGESPANSDKPKSDKEKERIKKMTEKANPDLVRVLLRQFGWRIIPLGFIKLLSDMCSTFSPFVIKYVITYIGSSKVKDQGIGYGMGLLIAVFALQILGSLTQNYFFQLAQSVAISVRGTLTAVVYRKSLRLSGAARQDFNAGKVMNVVSTDTSRIEQFLWFVHIMWTAPIQIIVITVFLIINLGPAALAGIALLLVITPLQGVLFKQLMGIRKIVAPITDSRVRLISEVLSGIRVIKYFAWEAFFRDRVEDIRTKEINQVFRRGYLSAFLVTVSFSVPIIAACVSFVIYFVTTASPDPAPVFASLSWFNLLRFPLMFLPQIVTGYADFKVAIDRISGLLLAAEVQDPPEIDTSATFGIRVSDGEFTWEAPPPSEGSAGAFTAGGPRGGMGGPGRGGVPAGLKMGGNKDKSKGKKPKREATSAPKTEKPALPEVSTLRNIALEIPKGSLVAIVGAVGSGKSSLLNAMIGEMKKIHGYVIFSGSVGYAPQSAWIQNASLKNNVLFGLPYNRERYLRAIRDCALESDLKILPDGDETEIGERGINISGGQKQRVNLARLVYNDADIVLMDDPLSAVDAHVGRYLMENCIQKALAGKTRILVTHQLHFVPRADLVIMMKDGQIAEFGTVQELVDANGEFAQLLRQYGGVEASSSSETEDPSANDKEDEATGDTKKKSDKMLLEILDKAIGNSGKAARELMQSEERAQGAVAAHVWKSYGQAAGGSTFYLFLILLIALVQGVRIGTDFWLADWTKRTFPELSNGAYVGIYLGFGLFGALATYAFGLFFAFSGARAARTLHEAAFKQIMRSPVGFFDTTPLGRIINRFSKDQDAIDNTIGDTFRMFANTLATAVSTFISIIYVTPWFAVPLLPLLVMYYYMQWMYRSTARELKRLDSLTRSPLYAFFGESLVGIATVRAYREQTRFINRNESNIMDNLTPYFLLVTAQRWVGIRLEVIGSLLVFFAGLFGVLARDTVDTSYFGLSMSYALSVTQVLNWCIRQFTETEVAMNAVERIEYYAYQIPTEAPEEITDRKPPSSWPTDGSIDIQGLSLRYAEDLPLVLKGVNIQISPREKIGIVGRTGSGKSSLMTALFRMVEPESGTKIIIDGHDILQLGLNDLRKGLAIIPQDATLFSASVRANLDPYAERDDAAVWDALARAGMKDKVMAMEGQLDAQIQEGGQNLSVGERQLMCLARALLRKPKIIVLDEATANVDQQSDEMIQKTIREDFSESTVLTIAHRLNTIIDYDRVLVLDQGEIVEFDKPGILLSKSDSRLLAMVEETGPANTEILKSLAQRALNGSSASGA
ncbi:P-loop containing nucleoside triphosphate hydrolase protein [Cladochytrium replicatum]|nr:P-loop containing nucleoside triphosphate hydrolase protein [Cladochytrium replicatum]